MVDVLLGIDEIPDRPIRLGQLIHLDSPGGQLRRIDHHDTIAGDHESGIAAPHLGLYEYILGNLFHSVLLRGLLPSGCYQVRCNLVW